MCARSSYCSRHWTRTSTYATRSRNYRKARCILGRARSAVLSPICRESWRKSWRECALNMQRSSRPRTSRSRRCAHQWRACSRNMTSSTTSCARPR
ncbi:TPA: hypothetical protein N0F65_004944 [Lagenidium giganteum]|uniref:Uncharacterized protein n=1 Tax=Lagenidium giganteum TaxID=4803 RepID=A0AAV2YV10_9STRA|nr:TPA: hypothetical protein N0F65_004944 [Lagenidium giganteum]